MKKLIILIAVVCFANDIKEILEMINLLHTQKYEYKPITHLYNPFVDKKIKNKIVNNTKFQYNIHNNTNIKKTYNLEIVFQNKVRINNKWYKNNDKLDNYRVIMKNDKVYLKNKKKIIELKRTTLLKVNK